MDNAPSDHAEAAPAPHIVEVEGSFGTVSWLVHKDLYSTLPRKDRDQMLNVTCKRVIEPFYRDSTDRMLDHVGYSGPPASTFDRSWSLETREVSCECIGQVIWNLSQGFWDALPEDQRDITLEMGLNVIYAFFHERVLVPLYRYTQKKMLGHPGT